MGMLMRATTVLATVLASTVVVGATTTPAQARVVPCTQAFEVDYYGEPLAPGQRGAVWLDVPGGTWSTASTRVLDIDVRVVVEMGYQPDFRLDLSHFSMDTRLLDGSTLPSFGRADLILDDEAPMRPAGASTGRWKPDGLLQRFDDFPASGAWRLEISNSLQGGEVLPRHFEVIITGESCDSDGDGVLERVDNCPTVVNPDQLDWDGDGQGNACDATPGTDPNAPVPTPVPTPATTPTPTPVPTTNPVPPTTGCTDSCAYVRTVELRHRAERHRFQGRVASVADGCRSSVPVTIWRKRSGADRKLVVVTSRGSGAFRTRAPRAAGRYYATVGSAAEPLCGTDRSRVVRVRRR